jgi:hypothetical protein
MVSSFRLTFIGFLDQRLASELYVSATGAAQADRIAAIATAQGVAVLPILSVDVHVAGQPAEIYGARDFSQRDREALRVVPRLARMLPERAVETLMLAVELDEMSEQLDVRVAARIRLPIDDAGYALAYAEAGTPHERLAQIEHVERIGRALEKLARLPLLTGMLHLMRGPAEAAGLSHLHLFLQRGFDAFKAMGPAGEFLQTIREREIRLMERLFAREAAPFRDLLPDE